MPPYYLVPGVQCTKFTIQPRTLRCPVTPLPGLPLQSSSGSMAALFPPPLHHQSVFPGLQKSLFLATSSLQQRPWKDDNLPSRGAGGAGLHQSTLHSTHLFGSNTEPKYVNPGGRKYDFKFKKNQRRRILENKELHKAKKEKVDDGLYPDQ